MFYKCSNNLDRNAYIMTAIYGYNFCTGARKSFTLLAKNAVRAVVLDKVADFVLFMGKLLVVIIVTAATFALFSNQVTSTLGNNLGIICTVTSNNIRYPTELPVCPHGHHHPRLLRHRLDLLLGVQHGCGHNISLLLTGLLTVLTHNFSSRQFYFEGSGETRRIP